MPKMHFHLAPARQMDHLRRRLLIRELGQEQGNFFNKGWRVCAYDGLLFLNFPGVNTLWSFLHLSPLLCTIFTCQIRALALDASITPFRPEDVRLLLWEKQTGGSQSWPDFRDQFRPFYTFCANFSSDELRRCDQETDESCTHSLLSILNPTSATAATEENAFFI